MPTHRICSIEGCDKRAAGRGWCPMHYQRWRLKGAVDIVPNPRGRPRVILDPSATRVAVWSVVRATACNVEACERDVVARGWCGTHYSRWRLTGTPDGATRKRSVPGTLCSVAACQRLLHTRGFCKKHYSRWRTHGHPIDGTLMSAKERHEAIRGWYDSVKIFDGEECLSWPFSRHRNGRPIWVGGGLPSNLVSRALCIELYGPSPTPKHQAAHSCGNGHLACVNPKHLYWATPKQNVQDMINHGTYYRGPRPRLTANEVRQIRSTQGKRTATEVAAFFGITPRVASEVARGITYKHVI